MGVRDVLLFYIAFSIFCVSPQNKTKQFHPSQVSKNSVTPTMHISLSLLPLLTPRSINAPCSTPSGDGTCQFMSDCTTQGFNLAGYCPNDRDNVQCCVKKTCSTAAGAGVCINTGDVCGGKFVAGACPGDSGVQCCVGGGGVTSPAPSSAPPPAPSGGDGSGIVSAAVKEEGLPYVWGGGGCAGSSQGGFDCSGESSSAILPPFVQRC